MAYIITYHLEGSLIKRKLVDTYTIIIVCIQKEIKLQNTAQFVLPVKNKKCRKISKLINIITKYTLQE